MFVITYRSYKEHHDKEVYQTAEEAARRMEQLKGCKIVDKLEIREVKKLP